LSSVERTRNTATKGFTLIEIMVVLAIMAALVAVLLPRIDNRNNKLKGAVRAFSTLCRRVHVETKLKGAVYRIALNLGNGADTDSVQSFWVEKSNQQVILSEKQEQEYRDALKDRRKDEERPKDPYGFEPDVTLFKKPQQLERPLRILMVEKRGYKESFTQGMAYIYFFPQGMSEMAVIQLQAGERLQWTIAIEPLTGRADIVTQLLTLKDLSPQ
jgi:general secretion pathway protein H